MRNYLKKIFIAFCIAFAVMIACFINLKYKIEIDYPNVNVLMSQVQEDTQIELDAKRAFENKVYANIKKDELYFDTIRITFVCNVGTEFDISNIRYSIGNLVLTKITDLENNQIQIHGLNYETDSGINYIVTTEENAWIEISGILDNLRIEKLKYLTFIFVITFFVILLVFFIVSVIQNDKKRKVEIIEEPFLKNRKQMILECLALIIILAGYIWTKDVVGFQGLLKTSEVLFLEVAIFITYIQLRKKSNNPKDILLGLMVISVFLFLSISDITTFLTVDEYQNIIDTSDINTENLRHWYNNVSHVNYVIMGTLWKLVPKNLIEHQVILPEQLGKLLHWICGIGLIEILANETEKNLLGYQEKRKRIQCFTVLMCVTLSIPVVLLALKNYNYDMFSMLLGAIGVIETLIYIKTKHNKRAILAVTLLALALSEKMIVLPAVYLCFCTIVAETAEKRKKIWKWIPLYTIAVLGGTIFIFWISQKYVMEILREHSPINGIVDAINCLCAYPYVGISALIKTIHIISNETVITMFAGALFLIGVVIGALIYRCMKQIILYAKITSFNRFTAIAVALFFIIGICSAFVGKLDISSSRIVFGLNYFRQYVSAYPTLILIIVFITVAVIYREKNRKVFLGIALVLDTYVAAAFYIAVKNTNFTHIRYSNIYILLFAIMMTVVGLKVIEEYIVVRKKECIGFIVSCVLVLCELIGSQPAFSYFIPVWNIKSLNDNEYGVSVYWGEQWKIAGDQIEEYCQEHNVKLENITLYAGYSGGKWLDAGEITIGDKNWMWKLQECSVTSNDFYVFETSAIDKGLIPTGLPDESVMPVIILKYRGKVTARIYQGNDLKAYFAENM